MTPTPMPPLLWTPTPMPMATMANPELQLPAGLNTQLAREIVGGYNYINAAGALDTVWLVITLFVIIGGVILVTRYLKSMGGD